MKVQFTRSGKAVTSSEAVTGGSVVADEVVKPTPAPAVQKVVEAAVNVADTAELDEEAQLEAQMKALKAKKKALKDAADLKAKQDAEEAAAIEAQKKGLLDKATRANEDKDNGEALDAQKAQLAVTSKQTTSIAISSNTANGIVEGDFDDTDVKPPRLQVVQGSGELANRYSHGTLLLDDTVLFKATEPTEPKPSFRFIPLGLIKAFRERLDQNDPDNKDVIPRIARSKEEVLRLGGTTEWQNGEQPTWNPTATVMMLIEKPENTLHTGFSLEAGGKLFCPAVFYASGTSYRTVAQKLFNASQHQLIEVDANGQPQRVIYKKYWTATLTKVPAGSYTVFTFDVRLGDEITGEPTRELCRRFLSGISNKKIEIAE